MSSQAFRGVHNGIPVIATSDGKGRAICLTEDKHWTITREWDEIDELEALVPVTEKVEVNRTCNTNIEDDRVVFAIMDDEIERVRREIEEGALEGEYIVEERSYYWRGDAPKLRSSFESRMKNLLRDEALARYIEQKEKDMRTTKTEAGLDYGRKLFQVAYPGVPDEEFDRLSDSDRERFARMGRQALWDQKNG